MYATINLEPFQPSLMFASKAGVYPGVKVINISWRHWPYNGLYFKHIIGKSYWGGRLGTLDFLVLTSLDQLIYILKFLFSFLQNKLP